MATEYFDAKILKIIDETHQVKRFQLEFIDKKVYDFIAGQYVKVDMPIESKKTYRQYSIASQPIGDNKIELLIVFNPVGAGTNYLFNVAKLGTILKISKGLGRFVLPEIIDRDITFICTGVGLAPFRSMYLELLNKIKTKHTINLIFGTRKKEDLCYAEELIELDKKYDNFNYYPVLSREGGVWEGRTGYVHPIYKELYSEFKPVKFYLCGWDNMIKEARKNLKEMGYERRDVLFEKYD